MEDIRKLKVYCFFNFSYIQVIKADVLFQELIKTERARELQQQRVAEESAAREAALKEMGRNQPG